MARIKPETWKRAKELYEFEDYSFDHISKDLKISKGALSKRSRAEGWEKGKGDRIVNEKIYATQKLMAANEQVNRESDRVQFVVNSDFERKFRLAGLMTGGIEKSQQAMNDLLDDSIAESQKLKTVHERAVLLVPVTDAHSKVTSRNAKTVFGNEGTEQQRETGNDAADERRRAIVAKIKARHAAARA